MKFIWLTIVSLLAFITLTQAYITQLTDENFSDLVEKDDEWLIDFYADWCGFCKRLEPKFQAADRLLGMSSHKHVKLGMVNVETNPGLAARFFVSRLPTVVHVKDHEVRVLPSTRNENDMISFVTLEEWRQVAPKSGFISPFSLFGKLVGFAGKFVKALSGYSPWTLIGVLTGFLVFAFSLPILASRKDAASQEHQPSTGETTATVSPQLRSRKSKRID